MFHTPVRNRLRTPQTRNIADEYRGAPPRVRNRLRATAPQPKVISGEVCGMRFALKSSMTTSRNISQDLATLHHLQTAMRRALECHHELAADLTDPNETMDPRTLPTFARYVAAAAAYLDALANASGVPVIQGVAQTLLANAEPSAVREAEGLVIADDHHTEEES